MTQRYTGARLEFFQQIPNLHVIGDFARFLPRQSSFRGFLSQLVHPRKIFIGQGKVYQELGLANRELVALRQ